MLENEPPKAGGNEAAVTVLERCTEIARGGKVKAAAIIMVHSGTDVVAHFGGLAGMELPTIGGAELLQDEMKRLLKVRNGAPINRNTPGNRCFYNCLKAPLAYDFLASLIQAEMRRVRLGAEGPLQVGWFWGTADGPDRLLQTDWQVRCFHNVMRPMVRLLGAVEEQAAIQDGHNIAEMEDCFSYRPIVEAYKRGEKLPRLTVPLEYTKAVREEITSKAGELPVVITLREATHHPFRNSNVPEWIKLAEWLQQQGEYVIFVRDTEKANEHIPGQVICSAASEDLLVRAALYQRAKCNLFVSNGPAMIPLFMEGVPWMMVNPITDHRDDFHVNTTAGWEKSCGFPAGEQWPWAGQQQRIIWEYDKFEPMRDAWLEHMKS